MRIVLWIGGAKRWCKAVVQSGGAGWPDAARDQAGHGGAMGDAPKDTSRKVFRAVELKRFSAPFHPIRRRAGSYDGHRVQERQPAWTRTAPHQTRTEPEPDRTPPSIATAATP